jgi:predicted CXXCH cytochrome family protein
MTGDVNANGMLVKPSGNTSYNADFTQDLRNDHPIGLVYDFGYPTPQNTAGLSTTISVSGPPFYVTVGGNNVFPIYGGTIGVGTLECASCHDPHTTAQPDFLRDAPTTICQDCHVNK